MAVIVQKLTQSPLMPSLVVVAVDKRYFDSSGLSDEEKAAGRKTLNRFVPGNDRREDRPKGSRCRDVARGGATAGRQMAIAITRERSGLASGASEAKARADAAGIPEQPAKFRPVGRDPADHRRVAEGKQMRATLLRVDTGSAGGDAAGRRAFVGVELGPDGEVIGYFQGLVASQVIELLEVEDAPAAGEFGR